MLVLLLAYAIVQSGFGGAVPMPSIERRDPSSFGESTPTRTTSSIVWSCLSTIFLCTWVSLHPNISSTTEKLDDTQEDLEDASESSDNTSENSDDRFDKLRDWFEELHGQSKKLLVGFLTYKLPLFLCALPVPEYILAWAIRQFITARMVKKEGWTRTHGFFLIMGGFQLFKRPDQPLHPKERKRGGAVRYSVNPGRFVRILGIDDMLQHKDKLVTTVSWTTEEDIKDRGKSDGIAKAIVLLQTLWFVIQCIARGVEHHPLTGLEIVTLAYVMMNVFICIFWWDKPRDVGFPIRVYESLTTSHMQPDKSQRGFFVKTSSYVIGDQDRYVILSQERKVPMFWSGGSATNAAHNVAVHATLGPSILGMAFAAVHFIAWPHNFPSYVELMLWRGSCIAMVAVPLFSAAGCTLALSGIHHKSMNTILFAFDVLLALSAWLYLVARAATIIVAFTTLRSLPSEAFRGIDWTTLIPHI